MNLEWLERNKDAVLRDFVEHAQITFAALGIGVVVALLLGLLAAYKPRTYPPILATTEVLYTIPSLAFFVLLVNLLGLGTAPVIVALATYSLVILVRNLVEGLRAVSPGVRDAATAMGYGDLRRLVTVELPLAAPAVIAGLRAAAVSTISLVSVGALIGVGGLGRLFIEGFQIDNPIAIWTGIAATVTFALLVDALIVGAGRLATPWTRADRS